VSGARSHVARMAVALAGVVALGAACNGSIIDPRSSGPGSSPGDQPGGVAGAPGAGGSGATPGGGDPVGDPTREPVTAQVACGKAGTESTGRRVLRRLTIAELDATVRGVFGLDATAWSGPTVPPDPASLDGFGNNVDRLTVSPDYARGALDTAKKVATLVASDAVLGKLITCSTAGGPPCAATFVSTVGPRLYRRPLTPAEQARYLALYDKVSTQGDFRSFVYWATLTMLQSPHVLYRSELGEPDGAGRYKLTPYEIAGALAYTFTGGPPSDELTQLAATNRLATPDQIETAARGLVFDAFQKVKPSFRAVMLRFADEWLGLSVIDNVQKNAQSFPDFSPQVQSALGEETRRFVASVVLEDKGTPATLLTAPYTFVDASLAKFYGFGTAGADFARVDRPAGWGLGLLAQGGLLAVEAHDQATSPTKRGYLVRTRIMCGTVPPPPDNVPQLPEPTAAETTRRRYESIHAVDAACKGCHQMLDPIGFGFEHLDATGRFRAREGNFDIDDSGVLSGTSMGDITFKGPSELATALAKLPETASCMASYMAAYALGVNQPNASCLVQSAVNELRGGMSLLDFYIRMARAEHFRVRVP
jgi:hypothetical protein